MDLFNFFNPKKEDVRVEKYQKFGTRTETKPSNYEGFVEPKKRENKTNANDNITLPPPLWAEVRGEAHFSIQPPTSHCP
jgi:hypothetical protein